MVIYAVLILMIVVVFRKPTHTPTPHAVSYYDWKGNYKGSVLYDSIHRYPDSIVYYYQGGRFTEPSCTYLYLPDLR